MVRSEAGALTASWRDWLPPVLLAFVASRVILLLVVALVESSLGFPYARDTYATSPLLGGLTGFDSVDYLGIAAHGYQVVPVGDVHPDWVFFPAYPIVTALVVPFAGGNVSLAGVLVANVALLVALCLIAILTRAYADAETVGRTVMLVAFAPGAVAFGLAYSDSLFLALAAGALLAARRQRFWLMGLLYAAAAIARLPGILLAIPLAIELWHEQGLRRWMSWVPLLAGPAALLAFAAYEGAALGDPLAFIHGQAVWTVAPITAPRTGPNAVGNPDDVAGLVPLVAIMIGILLAYTATLPGLVRSKLPRPEVALALVAFATVFLSGRLQSDARYLAVAWPFAWFLASRREPWRGTWLAVSASMYTVLGFLAVTQVLSP
jgi:Mannosyltransferase (PIG-V)